MSGTVLRTRHAMPGTDSMPLPGQVSQPYGRSGALLPAEAPGAESNANHLTPRTVCTQIGIDLAAPRQVQY
eukprot:2453186-Rhodomonas_salina.8